MQTTFWEHSWNLDVLAVCLFLTGKSQPWDYLQTRLIGHSKEKRKKKSTMLTFYLSMRKTQTEISQNYVCSLSATSYPPPNPQCTLHTTKGWASHFTGARTRTVRNSVIKGKRSFTLVAPQPHRDRQVDRQTDTHTDSMHPKLNTKTNNNENEIN